MEGTLRETNIAPENRFPQKETSIPNHPCSGAMLVSGRVEFLVFNHLDSSWLCDVYMEIEI